MEQEKEPEFTDHDRRQLRDFVRDIADLADQDLLNSGSPASAFGPWRLMFRQMLEAGMACAKTHPAAVSNDFPAKIQRILDSGILDPDGVAVTVPAGVLWTLIRDEMERAGVAVPDLWLGAAKEQVVDLLADALDTAYKSGAGAPPSHGSRFTRS